MGGSGLSGHVRKSKDDCGVSSLNVGSEDQNQVNQLYTANTLRIKPSL